MKITLICFCCTNEKRSLLLADTWPELTGSYALYICVGLILKQSYSNCLTALTPYGWNWIKLVVNALINGLGAACLAALLLPQWCVEQSINGLRTGNGLLWEVSQCWRCVCLSLKAAERTIKSCAVDSTYWLNEVSFCQRVSSHLLQPLLP